MSGANIDIGVARRRDAVAQSGVAITAPEACNPGIAADEFKRKSAVFLNTGKAFVEAVHAAGVHVNLEHGHRHQQSDGKSNHQLDQRDAALAARRVIAFVPEICAVLVCHG